MIHHRLQERVSIDPVGIAEVDQPNWRRPHGRAIAGGADSSLMPGFPKVLVVPDELSRALADAPDPLTNESLRQVVRI
jgi:hypothetical protein